MQRIVLFLQHRGKLDVYFHSISQRGR